MKIVSFYLCIFFLSSFAVTATPKEELERLLITAENPAISEEDFEDRVNKMAEKRLFAQIKDPQELIRILSRLEWQAFFPLLVRPQNSLLDQTKLDGDEYSCIIYNIVYVDRQEVFLYALVIALAKLESHFPNAQAPVALFKRVIDQLDIKTINTPEESTNISLLMCVSQVKAPNCLNYLLDKPGIDPNGYGTGISPLTQLFDILIDIRSDDPARIPLARAGRRIVEMPNFNAAASKGCSHSYETIVELFKKGTFENPYMLTFNFEQD